MRRSRAKLHDAAEPIRILDADTPAIRLDETAPAKILENNVDGLARQTNEITEIGLVQSQRDDDPCIVGDAVVRREVEKRMGDAGGRARSCRAVLPRGSGTGGGASPSAS